MIRFLYRSFLLPDTRRSHLFDQNFFPIADVYALGRRGGRTSCEVVVPCGCSAGLGHITDVRQVGETESACEDFILIFQRDGIDIVRISGDVDVETNQTPECILLPMENLSLTYGKGIKKAQT